MFSEADRQVFGPVFNGVEMVYLDPLAAHATLYDALDGEPNKWFAQMQSDIPDLRREARKKVVAAAREALMMAPWNPQDGSGALEVDVMAALNAFTEYISGKEKRASVSPMSAPLMGQIG